MVSGKFRIFANIYEKMFGVGKVQDFYFSSFSYGALDAIFVIYAKSYAEWWSRELWGPSIRWQRVFCFLFLLWTSRCHFRNLREKSCRMVVARGLGTLCEAISQWVDSDRILDKIFGQA